MPGRHSLFWRLFGLVTLFCLAMIWASDHVGRRINRENSLLSDPARAELLRFAAAAENALAQGDTAYAAWVDEMRWSESDFVVVLDRDLQPMGGVVLNDETRRQLMFVRHYEWPMSRPRERLPLVSVPFGEAGQQLVMRLPERLRPWRNLTWITVVGLYLVPVLLSVVFCSLLYSLLISPLDRLRREANAVRADAPGTPMLTCLGHRRDELGELGRSLEYLTRRLHDSIAQQQQLLRDLSHELRTPLSRLRVACESERAGKDLRSRVAREVDGMQDLVERTLELAWLDSEQSRFDCEPVDVATLWDVLSEDACFEAGWPRERILSQLPADCRVQGNLNALAQAMENVLRNAIRHSPPDGVVRLVAEHDGAHWCLSIEDAGQGVADDELRIIFHPFARLSAARPGGDGFGLGLAIAASMVRKQHGEIWAENASPGLRVTIRLQSV
ncbi:Sensor protein PfeS [Thauera humireducens]|uniref:sensor histidine kinase n=1 Tax=Thauera humireducens TaxID=1134435 RepID=UPI002467A96C|nr:sensor histidine kinase [Thauera humireducens]CAH1747772.1 Sensor protein PfeS [Thauera humireducens]